MVSLASAASEPWDQPANPSIWRELERRIQHRPARRQGLWRRLVARICPKSLDRAANHLASGLDSLQTEIPLRLAWTQDSVRELIDKIAFILRSRHASEIAPPIWMYRKQFLGGISLAVVAVLILTVLAVSHRQVLPAGSQVAVNPAPVQVTRTPIEDVPEQTMDVIVTTEPVTHSRASNSLVQAEMPAPIEPLASKPNPPAVKALARATAEATAVPTSSPQYDFYLEHGTPMPPESRGSKPAY
ncbi:MAG: hypothetical protein ACP5XB_15825 [Isosphaeraceae bacterium]